jgi:hypothetical protein
MGEGPYLLLAVFCANGTPDRNTRLREQSLPANRPQMDEVRGSSRRLMMDD